MNVTTEQDYYTCVCVCVCVFCCLVNRSVYAYGIYFTMGLEKNNKINAYKMTTAKSKEKRGVSVEASWWTALGYIVGIRCGYKIFQHFHGPQPKDAIFRHTCFLRILNPWWNTTLMRDHLSFKTTFSENFPLHFHVSELLNKHHLYFRSTLRGAKLLS